MTTGTTSSSALNAFGRAAEKHLGMLLATHQLDGEGATERGTGCDDPALLGHVLNSILAGLQTMHPTLYRQTISACKDSTSTIECIQQLMCDNPMSPSYYMMGWQCVQSNAHMREVYGSVHCIGDDVHTHILLK